MFKGTTRPIMQILILHKDRIICCCAQGASDRRDLDEAFQFSTEFD